MTIVSMEEESPIDVMAWDHTYETSGNTSDEMPRATEDESVTSTSTEEGSPSGVTVWDHETSDEMPHAKRICRKMIM